jgi:hypothetical protein
MFFVDKPCGRHQLIVDTINESRRLCQKRNRMHAMLTTCSTTIGSIQNGGGHFERVL